MRWAARTLRPPQQNGTCAAIRLSPCCTTNLIRPGRFLCPCCVVPSAPMSQPQSSLTYRTLKKHRRTLLSCQSFDYRHCWQLLAPYTRYGRSAHAVLATFGCHIASKSTFHYRSTNCVFQGVCTNCTKINVNDLSALTCPKVSPDVDFLVSTPLPAPSAVAPLSCGN
jgi:hypothetical protein